MYVFLLILTYIYISKICYIFTFYNILIFGFDSFNLSVLCYYKFVASNISTYTYNIYTYKYPCYCIYIYYKIIYMYNYLIFKELLKNHLGIYAFIIHKTTFSNNHVNN